MSTLKHIFITLFAVGLFCLPASAQERPNVPLRYGAHLGLNYNMAGVGYSDWLKLPERPGGSFIPFVLNDGSGIGLYGGLSAQWSLLDYLALQTRLSYDNRSLVAVDDKTHKGIEGEAISDEFDFKTSAVNAEVLAKLYIDDAFHVTGGGGVGIKLNSTYDYKLNKQEPVFADNEVPGASIFGSATFGLGYDIPLTDASETQQMFITPFVEMSYMMGMREVDLAEQSSLDDGLSVVTIRGGVAFTLGDVAVDENAGPSSSFFMITPPPDGIRSNRIVEEYFPLRPYVFFDSGNVNIPGRYNNISASDTNALISDFQSEFAADDMGDVQVRHNKQAELYYNLLNIIGYRLNHAPAATVTLIGSDPKEQNGADLANTVKNYLVNTWSISESRIKTQGQVNPRVPSGTARTPAEDRPAADAENRRVELTSDDAKIVESAMLRTERAAREENEIYVKITTNESIDSWQATITGNGQRKTYGPFATNDAFLDPTGLLGESSSGTFALEVIAKTADGRTLSESEKFVLKKSDEAAKARRYSLIFDYNDSDPLGRTRTFINAIVSQIPDGSLVVISGHTDNLGTDEAKLKLSKERAKQVKDMLSTALRSAGKNKVRMRASGYGEDEQVSPFKNDTPEGRMYNRTVIVDIIP